MTKRPFFFLAIAAVLFTFNLTGCPDDELFPTELGEIDASDDDATEPPRSDDDDATPASDQDEDNDGWNADADCDDSDADRYPGAPELCNGLDDDCDFATPADELDSDEDGSRICDDDCDDLDSSVSPDVSELCDETDHDCDGEPQNGFDQDSDGWLDAERCSFDPTLSYDCDDADEDINPDAIEVCNALDDDCDGQTDEGFDADQDGFTSCDGDCDDSDNDVYLGALEIPDLEDNDCDGDTDEGTVLADDDGDGYSELAGDCDDSDADLNPDDADGDGWSTCDTPEPDCDDVESSVNPGAAEVCVDTIDNDCDGDVDMADADCVVPP